MSVFAPDLKITARASCKDVIVVKILSCCKLTLQLPETAAWTDVFPSPSGTSVAAPCQKKSIAVKQSDWKPCRGETELLLYGRPQLLCGEGFDQRCPGWKLFLKREFEKTCLTKNIWIRLNTNLIQEKRFNWTKQFDESKCTASGFRLCKKTDQGGLLNEKKVLYTHYSEKNKITKNIVPNSSNKAKSLTSDLHLWIRFCAH